MDTQYRAVVKGVGHYLPETILTNHDLSKLMDTSDEWIRERTGICERRTADLKHGTSDLGLFASQEAIKHAGLEPDDIDLIIAATLSPDYFFPGIGVMIQEKLGINTVPAMDVRGQCSGFSWSMANADAFIRTGQYRKVLVVGSEIQTRVVEFSNRGRDVSVLFGDGAGAVVFSAEPGNDRARSDNEVRGVIDSLMGSDGKGASMLYIPRPGAAANESSFITAREAEEKAYLPQMDGRGVFRHAVTRMYESCCALLDRNRLRPEDIQLVIPHQANLRINEAVRERLGMKQEQFFNNIEKYGNTTAATLPIAMYEAEQSGRLKQGDLLLTVAFGSGFTWGVNLIRW